MSFVRRQITQLNLIHYDKEPRNAWDENVEHEIHSNGSLSFKKGFAQPRDKGLLNSTSVVGLFRISNGFLQILPLLLLLYP